MTETVCKSCGKPFLAERAGSVTSFFFQHNYCQCHNVTSNTGSATTRQRISGAQSASDQSQICKNCGKSRPTTKRAGSFTSFLFKELRCTCAGAVSGNSAKNVRPHMGRTTTAARTAQRRQFTQSIKNRVPTAHKSDTPATIPVGSVIGGFKIISLIGVGGMGAVYLVEHLSMHRRLALKILTPELVNEQNWQRFKAEAKILASLSHPTLVRVYDLGIHAGSIPFYSMDYLNGRSIEEILADDGPIDLATTIDIMLEVLDGLAYAHRHGIVHRDLKPGNIMYCTVDGARAVKVLDFGISKLLDSRSTTQALTVAGDIFGSPFYMSPEQSLGEAVDARSDIYSIGCTLFEMLTGFVPYENESSIEIMLMHQEADIPFLDEVTDIEFPPAVDLVLAKCLAKSPDDRYQSAKELALDLERIRDGKEVLAYAKGFAHRGALIKEKEEETARQTSISAIVLSGLAIAALIISSLVFYYWTSLQKTGSSNKPTVNAVFSGEHVLPSSEFPEVASQPKYISEFSKDGQSIIFHFPSNQPLGKINSDGAEEKSFDAQGTVTLPLKYGIRFNANKFMIEHPSLIEGFRPNDLACFTVPSSPEDIAKVKDAVGPICKLSGLIRLDLQLSNVNDEAISELNNLSRLEDLNVNFTDITGAALARLKRLKELHSISFNFNKGTHELVQALAGSETIHDLSLDSPDLPLSEDDLRLIAKMKDIHILNLQNCELDDKKLELLYGMPNLKRLNINGNPVTKEAIEKLKRAYGSHKVQVVSSVAELLESKGAGKGDMKTGF